MICMNMKTYLARHITQLKFMSHALFTGMILMTLVLIMKILESKSGSRIFEEKAAEYSFEN